MPLPWVLQAAVTLQAGRFDHEDGCSYWLGPTSSAGYPIVRIRGQRFAAHRLAAVLWWGPDAVAGKEVHHVCEHKDCVNPQHLAPLTSVQHAAVHSGLMACPMPQEADPGLVLTGDAVIAALAVRS